MRPMNSAVSTTSAYETPPFATATENVQTGLTSSTVRQNFPTIKAALMNSSSVKMAVVYGKCGDVTGRQTAQTEVTK